MRYLAIPSIISGESLSAYLIRLAHQNGAGIFDVIYNVRSSKKEMELYRVLLSDVDIEPIQLLDSVLLEKVTGINTDDILRMTFSEAINKFPAQKGRISSRISLLIEKKKRRFCPLCIAENGAFQLLWQVREIIMCNRHKVRLLEMCGFCGASQPFGSQSLIIDGQCNVCGKPLASVHVEYLDDHEIVNQERFYRDWKYITNMVSMKDTIFGGTPDNIIFAVLYYGQKQIGQFRQDLIRSLHPDLGQRFLWIMKTSAYDKHIISPSRLLEFLRDRNIELEDFATIVVPHSYQRSVKQFLSTQQDVVIRPGTCLAPWCSFYQRDVGMNLLKRTKTQFEYKHIGISDAYVCTGCYCMYGHTAKSGEWVEISELISMGYERIRPILNNLAANKGIKNISEELCIGLNRTTWLVAYLVRHELVDFEIVRRMAPKEIPSDIVLKFQHIDEIDGKLRELARKLYGWRLFDYLYYRSGYEVMRYFYMKSNRNHKSTHSSKGNACNIWKTKLIQYLRKCEQQGVNPSSVSAADYLKCKVQTLRYYKLTSLIYETKQRLLPKYEEQLINRVEDFLAAKPIEELTQEKCIKFLGLTRPTFKRNHPHVFEWFQKRFENHIAEIRTQRYREMLNRIPKIIEQLSISGENINQRAVSEQLGVNVGIFRTHHMFADAYREAAVTVLLGESDEKQNKNRN